MRLSVATFAVRYLFACNVCDPLFCDENKPCIDPTRPFMDGPSTSVGGGSSGGGVSNTVISADVYYSVDGSTRPNETQFDRAEVGHSKKQIIRLHRLVRSARAPYNAHALRHAGPDEGAPRRALQFCRVWPMSDLVAAKVLEVHAMLAIRSCPAGIHGTTLGCRDGIDGCEISGTPAGLPDGPCQ